MTFVPEYDYTVRIVYTDRDIARHRYYFYPVNCSQIQAKWHAEIIMQAEHGGWALRYLYLVNTRGACMPRGGTYRRISFLVQNWTRIRKQGLITFFHLVQK